MAGLRGALAGMVVCTLTATSVADPKPPTLEEAIKTASAAKKPLVIEFYAQWCGPCKVFEQDVLPKPDVQAALAEVVWVRYDTDDSPGTEAAALYRIDAFPTMLVVDSVGVERVRSKGLLDEAQFIHLLHDAKNQIEDEASIRTQLHAHPKDPAVHLRAARWFDQHAMATEAISHYTCVARDKTAAVADRNEAAAAAEHLHRVDVWRHDLVADKVTKIRSAVATAELEDLAIATVDSVLPPNDVHALLANVLAAQTDVARINAMVYIALAAGANNEALAAAKRLVELSRQAQFLDTLAECHHASGDRTTALQLEDEALKLVAGGAMEETLKRNRARFDRGTGEVEDVTQIKDQVAELWKRLSHADRIPSVGMPPTPNATANNTARGAAMAAWQKSWDAEKALATTAATACAKEAGETELALAQVDLDPTTGAITKTKVLTEAGVPKLAACITKALHGASLPVMPNRPKREIRIQFAHP